MKKYSILVIGIDCYFGHIKEFIINLKKKNPQAEISLVVSKSRLKNDDFSEINGYVNRIVMHNKVKVKKGYRYDIKLLNILFYYLEFFGLMMKGRFDIVDIHFPNKRIKYVMPFIKRMTNNIVITPWGSDVMRVEDEKSISDMRKIYSQANYITIGKGSPIGKCAIAKFKVNPEKMVKLGWGGEFFDFIQEKQIEVSVDEAKARFGLSDKYVITCGYNTQKEQRHAEIIDAINSVRNQLPKNLILLFPFTYGRSKKSDRYTDGLKEKCKDLCLDFVSVEDHLEMYDLLKLRMATDIFVHVQTTDAGSRCVMEYVACNKKVVHGSWIKYSYLEDNKPSCYFPVDQIENLGSCIVNAYHSGVDELPQKVKRTIYERGWNYKMDLWNKFFESIVS